MLAQLRKDVVEHCRSIARALLPPRPNPRGRPANPTVTRAITLYRKFRRESPDQSPRKLWARVYPKVIDGWANMSDLEQRNARDELRERIAWRRRKRRKIPTQLTV